VTRRRRERVAAIEILDDAVRLLRAAPWSAHLCFQAGGLPFVLGSLLFVMDMRRSALAPRHASEAALLMALLYLWMKGWQAIGAARLRAALTGEEGGAPRGGLRLALAQAAIQPWSLYAIPIAAIVTLPFAWIYAYYHAATLTGDAAAARAQAVGRPVENHVLVLLLSLMSFVVWVSLLAVVVATPFILSSLFGIETPFSRSPMLLFDSTVFLAAGGLAYLVMAPVAHAAYLVRAERAAALRTGSDLLREIEALPPLASGRAVACVLAALGTAAAIGLAAPAARAAPVAISDVPVASPAPAPETSGAAIAPADLEEAMRTVTARPEFLWRMPRAVPGPDEVEQGVIGRFMRSVFDTVGGWWDAIVRLAGRLFRWLEKHWRPARVSDPSGDRPRWPVSASWVLLGILVLGGGLAFLTWRRRRPAAPELRATVAIPLPRADVGTAAPADAPSDEWLAQARDLLEHGDPRFAARAMYLAMLALLGEARLLTLGRSRSDRDYLLELRRRRPDRPEMSDLLQGGVREFERVWYGTHPASVELVRGLGERCESLRRHARG
jgi:hypothetical protein